MTGKKHRNDRAWLLPVLSLRGGKVPLSLRGGMFLLSLRGGTTKQSNFIAHVLKMDCSRFILVEVASIRHDLCSRLVRYNLSCEHNNDYLTRQNCFKNK